MRKPHIAIKIKPNKQKTAVVLRDTHGAIKRKRDRNSHARIETEKKYERKLRDQLYVHSLDS